MISDAKILITGGLGFIGGSLAKKLRDQNNDITILDNLSPQVHSDDAIVGELTNLGCNVVIGDVQDKTLLKSLMTDINVVYHLAAETGTGQSMYELARYRNTNIVGTECLLECVDSVGSDVQRLVLASSRSVYGEGKYLCQEHGEFYPSGRDQTLLDLGEFDIRCERCNAIAKFLPTDEMSPRIPKSIYAATKSYQEDLFRIFHNINLKKTTIFRFQNVYGPGQSLSNPYTGIISIFYNLIKSQQEINIFEDGGPTRDFIYIDDVVYYLSTLPQSDRNGLTTVNLGTGIASSVLDVLKCLENGLEMKAKYSISSSTRSGDIRNNIADLNQLNQMYGDYSFKNLENGINQFIAWANRHFSINQSQYLRSLDELRSRNLLK